jgi:hypothetical protein
MQCFTQTENRGNERKETSIFILGYEEREGGGEEFYIDRLCHNMNDRRGAVLQTGNLKMIRYDGTSRNS